MTDVERRSGEVAVAIELCDPVLVRVPQGWMATTPHDHAYRIGTVGRDQQEARARFEAALLAWSELDDRVRAERDRLA
jgi:hypothetical protein